MQSKQWKLGTYEQTYPLWWHSFTQWAASLFSNRRRIVLRLFWFPVVLQFPFYAEHCVCFFHKGEFILSINLLVLDGCFEKGESISHPCLATVLFIFTIHRKRWNHFRYIWMLVLLQIFEAYPCVVTWDCHNTFHVFFVLLCSYSKSNSGKQNKLWYIILKNRHQLHWVIS